MCFWGKRGLHRQEILKRLTREIHLLPHCSGHVDHNTSRHSLSVRERTAKCAARPPGDFAGPKQLATAVYAKGQYSVLNRPHSFEYTYGVK